MRIAFSSLACPGWRVEEIGDAAARYGFDGIEWRLADGALLGPATQDGVWERIAGTGVAVACLDTSCWFVQPTTADREQTIAGAVEMAERAARIGSPAIRVFAGPIPEGARRDEIVPATRDALAAAAAAVRSMDVAILVETHDAWSRGSDIVDLMSGGVGVVWDVAHTIRAGESPEQTLGAIGVPGLVHAKDVAGETLVHLGEGSVPFDGVLRGLRSRAYDGWVSFEWEKQWHPELDDATVALPRAATYLRLLVAF